MRSTPRRLLAYAILAIAVLWAAAIVAAPRLLASPARTIAAAVYVGAGHICHQRPERSFRMGDRPMPVCARCTGLYLSAPVGLASILLWRRRRQAAARALAPGDRTYRWWRLALGLAALPTLASIGLEQAAGLSCNISRALTAAPLGAAVAALVGAVVCYTTD